MVCASMSNTPLAPSASAVGTGRTPWALTTATARSMRAASGRSKKDGEGCKHREQFRRRAGEGYKQDLVSRHRNANVGAGPIDQAFGFTLTSRRRRDRGYPQLLQHQLYREPRHRFWHAEPWRCEMGFGGD